MATNIFHDTSCVMENVSQEKFGMASRKGLDNGLGRL